MYKVVMSKWNVFTQLILINFILLGGFLTSTHAQPTLNPEQTVNPATGEMGFSLPLATLKGIGGSGFPVALNYSANIRLHQQATPAGLGFSYGPGIISRKEVFVPDENVGGISNYLSYTTAKSEVSFWYWVVNILVFAIFVALSVISGPIKGWEGFFVGLFLTFMQTGVSTVVNNVTFGSINYVAGHQASMQYTPEGYMSPNHGKGLMNDAKDDIPDIYFLSTPFLSGEFRWVEGDHYVFRRTEGSSIKGKETVKIRCVDNKFYLTLADGTRMFFEKHTKVNRYSEVYTQVNIGGSPDDNYYAANVNHQKQPVNAMWVLTKILYSDYVDGGVGLNSDNEPLNSTDNNRGSWVVFEYGDTTMENVQQLPDCYQVGKNSVLVSTSGNFLNEIYLTGIKTPNEYAEYKYRFNRKDDLWFDIGAFNWWESIEDDCFSVNSDCDATNAGIREKSEHQTAAYYCTSKSGAPVQPKPRPVLDSILIYTATGEKRTSVKFNYDYFLRPSTFHSYTKGAANNVYVAPSTENSNAACLTLMSVEIRGADGTVLPKIKFKYTELNPPEWKSGLYFRVCGSESVPYFHENRDLWGFYHMFDYGYNEFQHTDSYLNKANEAKAWSLEEVELPTGLKLTWEYEANRYDASNGVKELSGRDKKPIYGGGVRVRKVTANGGNSTPVSLTYAYTCDKGDFVEKVIGDTTNCSGHATCEPYNSIVQTEDGESAEDADYREQLARRGGVYTPAKVAYEMVQVIKNYQEPTLVNPNGLAPEGYTTMRYLTSLEHPNGGAFGEVDSAWKRGYLVEKEVYNSAGEKISSENHTYEFEDDVLHSKGHLNKLHDPIYAEGLKYTQGIIKHSVKIDSVSRVGSRSEMLYRTNVDNGKRCVVDTVQKIDVINNEGFPIMYSWGACVCAQLDGNLKEDVIIAQKPDDNTFLWYLDVKVIKNIDFEVKTFSPDVPLKFQLTRHYNDVLGVGYCDFSGNAQNDLIVILRSEDNNQSNILIQPFIDSYSVLNSNPCQLAIPELLNVPVTTAVIYDFDGNGKPDILLYQGDETASVSTKLYVIKDISYSTSSSADVVSYVPPVFISDNSYTIKAKHATICDYDGNGTPDLLCSGPDFESGSTPHVQMKRYLIKDVGLDDGGVKKVIAEPMQTLEPVFSLLKKDIGENVINGNSQTLNVGFWRNTLGEQTFVYGEHITRCKDSSIIRDLDGEADQQASFYHDTILVSVGTPAYIHTPEMGDPAVINNKHMITQGSDMVTYKVLPGTTLPIEPTSYLANALAAQSTTWRLEYGRYLPSATYAWSVAMGADGMPTAPLVPFVHVQGATNANWELTDTICKYSRASLPVWQQVLLSPNERLSTVTVYGHKGTLPIASISDATQMAGTSQNTAWEEYGVFTGDYNNGESSNFWDIENGWEKGSTNSVHLVGDPDSCHFGDSVIHVVNDYAAGRNNRIIPGKAYEMTAWVKVISGEMLMASDFRWVNSSNLSMWPQYDTSVLHVDYNYGVVYDTLSTAEAAGEWKMMKITIPASITSQLPTNNGQIWYARAWVGRDPNDYPVDGYVDDVRFAPAGAFISSTFYHPVHHVPVLNVDANNQPGNRVTYDGFGRPVKWEKVDSRKSKGESATGATVSTRKYQLERDGIVITKPALYDVNSLIRPIKIQWKNEMEYDVVIYYSFAPDSPWTYITTLTHTSGVADYEYDWTVPDLPRGETYRIRVENAVDDKIFDNSQFFTIARGLITKPVKGNLIQPGTNFEINWDLREPSGTMVELFLNNVSIGTSTNTGTYVWAIPLNYSETDNSVIRIDIATGEKIYSDTFKIGKYNFIRKYIYNLLKK